MLLLIRRNGTLIDLSPDGRSGLPPSIVDLLHPYLRYTYKVLRRGYDPGSGARQGVELSERLMYRIEEGRLVTMTGFVPRLVSVLSQAGHDVRYLDVTPPRPRSDCYDVDWTQMERYGLSFRPRQEDMIRAVINNPLGGMLIAPTGFGKTHQLMILSLLYSKAKIAIVVEPVEVAEKIASRLTTKIANVGLYGGGSKTKGRVTVYTAASMHHADGDEDILFCDEAHQLMSPQHSELLGQTFRFTRNYGLTATPEGRLDGASSKLECFFGPQLFHMTYQEAVDLGLVVPIYVRWLPIFLTHNPAAGKTGVPRMRWGVWRNDERNAIIAADARMYPPEVQVLILVQTIDHAIHLWQHLPEFQLCYAKFDAEDCERYKRNHMLPQHFQMTNPERREALRRAFEAGTLKRVIATDVWSTGVDFEQLAVCYDISARSSEIGVVQRGGRPSRIYEGKAYSEVVDCIDYFDKTLRNKSESRKRVYRRLGWADNWPSGRRQISQHG